MAALGFLIYNVIAFGLQPILGFYCDNHPSFPMGIAGCLIVTAGLAAIVFPWAALIICAIGNACFHIGGGIDSLIFSNGKMYRSGIFVSSGAIGVTLGTYTGQLPYGVVLVPFILMITSVMFLFISTKKQKQPGSYEFHLASHLSPVIIILLAFIAIMIRSYAGSIIPMNWKTGAYIFFPGICACFGKVSGGFLGDKFGARTIGVLALFLSIPLLYFGENTALISMAGIVLFNMTMPITLCTMASVLKHNPGLTFGLTTLALLCGSIPTYFISVSPVSARILVISFTLLSAFCTFISIKKRSFISYEKII